MSGRCATPSAGWPCTRTESAAWSSTPRLFTEDAEWLMPEGPRRGRADILAGATARREAGGVGPGSNSRHMITSLAVEFAGPDEAVADSYFLYVAETHETPQIQLVGYYHDTLRRTPEGWLMARREITFG